MRARLAPLALALACCAAPRAPPGPPLPAPVAPEASSAAPDPDPGPAPDPEGLVLTLRISRPGPTADEVLHVLRPLLPWGAVVPPDVAIAAGLGRDVADAVDLDGPADLAVARRAGAAPLAAIAVSLRPPREALAALEERFRLVPGPGGVLALSPRAHDDADPVAARMRACEVAPARGGPPLRLVCGADADATAALAPYLTRTAARADTPADAHLEVRLRPFLDELSRARQTGRLGLAAGAPVERVGAKIASALAFGPFGEVEALSLDLRLGAFAADLTASAQLEGDAATIARLAAWTAPPAGPPPEGFFHLPEGTGTALFTRGAGATALDPLGPIVFGAPPAGAQAGGETERRLALFASRLLSHDPLVIAHGRGGWLAAIEEPGARWTLLLRDVAAAPPGGARRVALAPLPRAAGLPKIALHLEIRTAGAPDAHVLVVPGDTRTWIAVGRDPALAAARVREAVLAPPRAGLDEIRAAPLRAGGFTTLADLGLLALELAPPGDAAGAADLARRIAALPSRGETPIQLLVVPGSAAGTWTLRIHAPRAAIDDLVELAR